jgi:hypothetical protein
MPKKWSQKHDSCVKCKTKTEKHIARGLCVFCYAYEEEMKNRGGIREGYGLAAKKLNYQYLYEEYVKKKRSLGDIAKVCNCSRQYVYKQLKSFDIKPRDKTFARKIALDRGKIVVDRIDAKGETTKITFKKISYRDGFFDTWSPEMAYVLGVIYSDGCLHPGKLRDPNSKTTCLVPRLSIHQKEPELLQKVLSLMGSNAKIYHRGRKIYHHKMSGKEIVAGEISWFNLHGNQIYDALLKLGVTPNKSLTVNFPQIPQQFVRHFIRGCWDGDGSIYLEKPSNKKAASYVSGSKSFIGGMLAELEKLGMPKRTIHERRGKNISYYFRFTGDQCDKLFHILYDDVPSSQYLERKYNISKSNESDEGLGPATQAILPLPGIK